MATTLATQFKFTTQEAQDKYAYLYTLYNLGALSLRQRKTFEALSLPEATNNDVITLYRIIVLKTRGKT